MPIFSFQEKWKNIFVLGTFFLLGYLFIEPIYSGLFILITAIFSRLLAKEYESGETYFDEYALSEFSKVYYYAFYRMLFASLYVYTAFSMEYQATLDVLFFLIWLIGSSILWYTAFFIPADGEMDGKLRTEATIGMLFCGIWIFSFIAWIVLNVGGIAWTSSMISNPLKFIYNY